MTEEQLRDQVCGLLSARGYVLATEVPFWLHRLDILAHRPGTREWLAVEVKLAKWQRALEQARVYQLCVRQVYIAMPVATAHRADLGRLQAAGVGLWAVGPDLRELASAKPSQCYRAPFHQSVRSEWLALRASPEGGVSA